MRVIYLYIGILLGTINLCKAQFNNGGPTCAAALAAQVSLPYIGIGQTTCNQGDNLNDQTPGVDFNCTQPFFYDGEDYFYAFTASQTGSMIITMTTLTPSLAYSLSAFEGCPETGGRCMAAAYESLEPGPIRNLGITVEKGKTYVIVVDQADDPNTPTEDCINQYTILIPLPDTTCANIVVEAKDNSGKNADFETNSLNFWKGYTGTCCPINTTIQGFASTRHTIMEKDPDGTTPRDPNTGDIIPVVCPDGGKYSVRLGNDQGGAQAESMELKFLVTPNTNGIIYKYAVVIQNPNHADNEQPRFDVHIDGLKDPSCGDYQVVAGAGAKCFQSFGGQLYKNWTSIGVNLSDPYYLGQFVTIKFSTGDCSLGGHYGYAYIDMALIKMQIQLMDSVEAKMQIRGENRDSVFIQVCDGVKDIRVSAPEGFKKYLWSTGDSSQTIILKNVNPGDSVSVTLSSEHGFSCKTQLKAYIERLPLPTVAFSAPASCANKPVDFQDQSSTSKGNIDTWYWEFGDGTNSTEKNPSHIYNAAGTYNVKLISGQKGTCLDSTEKTVNILAPLDVKINSTAIGPCSGMSLEAVGQGGSGPYEFVWGPELNNDAGPFNVNPEKDTYYFVSLKDPSPCDASTDTILVLSGKSRIKIPNAFSPNGDGINDKFNPMLECIKSYQIKIFNRWGQILFQSSEMQNDWNLNSEKLLIKNSGNEVFVYVMDIVDNDNIKHSFTGTVVLSK